MTADGFRDYVSFRAFCLVHSHNACLQNRAQTSVHPDNIHVNRSLEKRKCSELVKLTATSI